MDSVLLYIGGALPALWGLAHLFPTRNIVKGFGPISEDNKHIITMEWIIEGIALIYLGALVIAITAIDPAAVISRLVYLFSIMCLLVLAVVSLFTGFKIKFPVFKMCPFIFTGSAILIYIGGF